ncbi:MAG: site-specific integrase [Bacillota bacterium]|nr:site-specific integrase [Bacillota bacterium]
MPKAKKLPSGSWYIQVSTGKKEKGKYKYESRAFPSKEEAEFWAAEYNLHKTNISKSLTNLTLEEAMTRYIESKDCVLSPSTIAGYKKLKKNCLQGLMKIKLNKITQEMIQKEINAMAKDHASKYVSNAHGLLNSVFKEYYPDFTLKTALPQKQPYSANIPATNEIELIIKAVKDTSIELPVLLALWQGMRMSEIRGIKWDSIKGDMLHIKTAIVDAENKAVEKGTKTVASNRKIKLPNYLLDLIKKQPKNNEFIVTLSGQAIYKRFTRLCEKEGLPHYRFHDLRHTNASVMLALKIPDKYAMERGGWATNNTLKTVYQHTMSDERKIVDDKVNTYFESLLSYKLSHDVSNV